MSGKYDGMAIGVFELDSECACFVALDAAAKAAGVKIQSVERNRLGAGACVKMRGSISDVKAAMEAALAAAVAVASLQQALKEGKVEKDATIMLNITGGGIGRFKSENEYYHKKPDFVFAVDADPEYIRRTVVELFQN